MVRMRGLEPPRLAAPDPKSGASANSATSACKTVQAVLYSDAGIISTGFNLSKEAGVIITSTWGIRVGI